MVRRLWASFPNEALKIDRDSGRYADAPCRAVTMFHPARPLLIQCSDCSWRATA